MMDNISGRDIRLFSKIDERSEYILHSKRLYPHGKNEEELIQTDL